MQSKHDAYVKFKTKPKSQEKCKENQIETKNTEEEARKKNTLKTARIECMWRCDCVYDIELAILALLNVENSIDYIFCVTLKWYRRWLVVANVI